jgi:hypothetical protein
MNLTLYQSVQSRQLAVKAAGSSQSKKSTCEDLNRNVKTLIELYCSDIRSECAVERRIGSSAVQFGAVSEW